MTMFLSAGGSSKKMDKAGSFDLQFLLKTLRNGKWILVSAAILAMTIAAVGNYFQALQYQASAQIQIEPPPFLPAPGQNLASQSDYYTNIDRYFKTQTEKLSSRRMRTRFAEELRKDSAYAGQSTDEIATGFERGFSVEPVRDTNLISVHFVSTNPDKAARWLNLYAELFVQDNALLQEENVRQSRELLKAQLSEVKELLNSQQAQMNELVGAVEANPTEASSADSDLLTRYQISYEEAKKQRLEEEQKLKKIETSLAPGADPAGAPYLERTSGIGAYLEKLAEARVGLNKLRMDGKGEEHPQVSAKKSEISNFQEQIRGELKKSAEAMRLNLAVLQNTERSALKNYRESLAQKRSRDKQALEMGRVEKMLDTWTNAFSLVEDKLRSLKVIESFVSNNISVVEKAEPEPHPVSKRGIGFVLLMGVGGFLLGSTLLVAGEALNPKIRGIEEIQDSLAVPSLGILPRTLSFDLHEIREAYNVLRTELLFPRSASPDRVIMLASSIPQEGKTTVTLNLGKTLAMAGDSAVIVDFDFRKSRLRSLAGPTDSGDTSLFSPVDGLELRLEATSTPLLHLLAPSQLPDNPPFLLSQPGIRELIQTLRERYQWILIDTPPVALVTDAVILASLADSVIFVIRNDCVDKRIAKESIAALTNVGARIRGAVLNDVDVKKSGYYSYRHYYGRRDEFSKEGQRRRL
jgi:polysaccharide biosynthesis transport protein